MVTYYDELERRSQDRRASEQLVLLQQQIGRARALPGYRGRLDEVEPAGFEDLGMLADLPVLRKSELVDEQRPGAPLGGFSTIEVNAYAHVFQSPGPIYEPGQRDRDWWRLGRFLHALGIGKGDIVQNCFSYHMTPAGLMFESAAAAVGATIFPAGIGQTELQIQAAHHLAVTAYAGTPDYLKTLLEGADEAGLKLGISRAAVSGGALFPSLREYYSDRGIACLQCYATADLGNIAYESATDQGLIVDEGVIVEIVRPGTGMPVAEGEVGEVVVTSLTPDYPLIRFATGDLSAVLPGESPCGRTNQRIKGWLGRADQTTKVKGMFVRPEQVAAFVARHPEVSRARVIVTRANDRDELKIQIETPATDPGKYETALVETLKLRGVIELVEPGGLPNDGKVIDDQRDYET